MRRKSLYVAIAVICGLALGLLAIEGLGRIFLPVGFATDYERYLEPTPLDSSVDRESIEYEMYQATRHLTGTNNQPKVPHPFLGHVYSRLLGKGVNSAGFFERQEVPYARKPDEFAIGIFGGSVAKNFVVSLWERRVFNESTLQGYLERHHGKELKGRKVRVINYGVTAYKQPQQFIAAVIYGDGLDLAINIDGYNEASAWNPPEFPTYFPVFSNLFYSHDFRHQRFWLQLFEIRQDQMALAESLRRSWVGSTAVGHLAWRAYMRIKDAQTARLYAMKPKENQTFNYYPEGRTLEAELSERAATWEKYTRLQFATLKAAGVPSLYFIQPNQYIPNSKPLSDEEKKLHYQPSRTTEEMARTYAKISEAALRLRKEGVPVFDLTQMFAKEHETVYGDACCHLNSYGNVLLEQELAREIGNVLKGVKD